MTVTYIKLILMGSIITKMVKELNLEHSNSFKIDKSYYIDDIKKYLNDNDKKII